MQKPVQKLARFLREENGATAIEYALIASAMFFAVVTAIQLISGSLADLFNLLVDGFTAIQS